MNSFNKFGQARWYAMVFIGVITAAQVVRGNWFGFVEGLLSMGIMAVMMWVWLPIFIRQLADQYLFFLRAKEMRAYMIEKDGKLVRLIIAVLAKDRPRFEVLKMEQEARGIRVDLVDPSSSLYYIGVPWKFKAKFWFEYPADETSPELHPQYSMILSERTIDYQAPEVPTADFIEITAKLVISLIVVNPLKAVYGVNHYMEAVIFLINSRWRRVATTLHFFYYGEDAEAPKDLNTVLSRLETLKRDPEIYQKAHGALLVDLWLAGRCQKYKVAVGEDGNPKAIADGRPEPRYWNVQDSKVMDGTETFGGNVYNVYGDFEGRFFYVREEADESLVLMCGKEGESPISFVESDRSKVVVRPEQRVLFLFTKSGDSWDGVRAYFKYGIPADKPARRLVIHFGVFPKDVEIQDIGTQRNIKEALEKPAIAIANALAARQEAEGMKAVKVLEAEGEKQAKILQGEGEEKRLSSVGAGEGTAKRLVGEGEGAAVLAVHKGHADGFAAQMAALGIKPGEAAALSMLSAEAVRQMAISAKQLTVIGAEGINNLFGVVPALAQLWNREGNTPSEADVIKVLSGLSVAERQSVFDALPRTNSGEDSVS
ncbi:MAG: hypothetical protein WCW66_02280 [Patescibacteria group bacterium]